MCSLEYHDCPACREEYKCTQSNSECPVINHYDSICGKCEYWIDEERREDERDWERKQYEKDHPFEF